MFFLDSWLAELIPHKGLLYWLYAANYLLALRAVGDGGSIVRLHHEKRVLASLLGMTPENLSRSFAALNKYGVAVQGSVVLCMCVASEPTPEAARDRVSRYLTRANVVQQFACLAMSSDGRLFARTAIDTEGIPVTKRSLTQLVNACELLAVMFLPIGHRVARREIDPDAAAEQSEAEWQTFVEAQRTP